MSAQDGSLESPASNSLQSPQVVQSFTLDIPSTEPNRTPQAQDRPGEGPGSARTGRYIGHDGSRLGGGGLRAEEIRRLARLEDGKVGSRAAAAEHRRRSRVLSNPRANASARVTSYAVYQGRLVRENPSTQSLKKLLVHPILESPRLERNKKPSGLSIEIPQSSSNEGPFSPRGEVTPMSARGADSSGNEFSPQLNKNNQLPPIKGAGSAQNSPDNPAQGAGQGDYDRNGTEGRRGSMQRRTKAGKGKGKHRRGGGRHNNTGRAVRRMDSMGSATGGNSQGNGGVDGGRRSISKPQTSPANNTSKKSSLRSHQRHIEVIQTKIANALRPDPNNFNRVDIHDARIYMDELIEYIATYRAPMCKTMRGTGYIEDLNKYLEKCEKRLDSSTTYERLRPLVKHADEAIYHLNGVLDNRTSSTPTHTVLVAWKDANKSVNAMDRSYYQEFKSEIDRYKKRLKEATERCYLFSIHNLLTQKKHLEAALRNQHMRINAEIMLEDLNVMLAEEEPLLLCRTGGKNDAVLDDTLKPTRGMKFYDEMKAYTASVKSRVSLAAFNNEAHQDIGVVQSLARQVIYAVKHKWEAEVRLRWVDLKVATKFFTEKGRQQGWDTAHMQGTIDLVNEAKTKAFAYVPDLKKDVATEQAAAELDIGRERDKDKSGAKSILPPKPVPGRVTQAVTDAWRKIQSLCTVSNEEKAERNVDEARQDWRTVRVYVCGSSLDTSTEREILRTQVFPELREMCLARRIHLQEVDLRAGRFTELPMSEKTVCDVIEQVHRCGESGNGSHPFFVSIMGEKHGDLIHKFQVPHELRQYVPTDGLGLTVLENIKGAYIDKNPNAFFYFRDPSYIREPDFLELPDVVQATQEEYKEEQSKIDKMIGGLGTSANSLLMQGGKTVHVQKRIDTALKFRLNTFKDHVRERFGPSGQVYDNYPAKFKKIDYFFEKGQMRASVILEGLEDFAERVKNDLWKALCAQYPLDRSGTKAEPILEDNSDQHRHFVKHVESNAMLFPNRLDELLQAAKSDSGVVIITGDKGLGKSTALAQLSHILSEEKPDAPNLVFFHGVGPMPFSYLNIFVQLCYQLQHALGVECASNPVPTSLEGASRYFQSLLEELAEQEKEAFIFLDGLDSMGSPEDVSHHMPSSIPPGVHIIISSVPDAPLVAELRGYYPRHKLLPLPSFKVIDMSALTRHFLFRRNNPESDEDSPNGVSRPPSAVPVQSKSSTMGGRLPPVGEETTNVLFPSPVQPPPSPRGRRGGRPGSQLGGRRFSIRPVSSASHRGTTPSGRRYSVAEEVVDLELPDSAIDEMMVRNKALSPLWALLASDEIYHRKFDHGDDALQTYAFIQSLPETVPELCKVVLARLEDRNGKNIMKHSLSFLVLSQTGLLEAELHGLLNSDKSLDPSPSEFLDLILDISSYIRPWQQSEQGCMALFHSALRDAVFERYLDDPAVITRFRTILSRYFRKLSRTRLAANIKTDTIDLECPRSVREAQYQDHHGDTAPNLELIAIIRPFIESDVVSEGCTLLTRGPQVILTRQRPYESRLFTFDHTFWMHDQIAAPYLTEQDIATRLKAEVFKQLEAAKPVNLITYGQTGSGKTRTLFGTDGGPDGVAISLIQELFTKLRLDEHQVAEESAEAEPGVDGRLEQAQLIHTVRMSFLEVYSEKVRDLLADEIDPELFLALKIREHPKTGPYVEGACLMEVSSPDQIEVVLRKGLQYRVSRPSLGSPDSSRSHIIITLHIDRCFIDPQNACETTTTTRLNFVDLAGTERESAREGRSDEEWQESVLLQRSLGAITNCLTKLKPAKARGAKLEAAGKNKGAKSPRSSFHPGSTQRSVRGSGNGGKSSNPKQQTIPYRDSVVTYLLRSSLIVDSKTFLLTSLRPDATSYEETLAVLRKMKDIQSPKM